MVYLFLADGFEEIEAFAPVDILRRAGVQLATVGVGGRQIKGAHGIAVTADLLESDVSREKMEMVILPGGMPGTKNLERSPSAAAILPLDSRRSRTPGKSP
jgi:4-methyl-5(b-hydroxyethyl)-thiazole monophosphate biosynthesis